MNREKRRREPYLEVKVMFRIAPLSARFGAEVKGIDVRSMDDAGFAALRRLWLDWKVLVIRDQNLTASEVSAFGARFGPNLIDRFVAPHPRHPELMEIVRHAGAPGRNFGGLWHTDVSYLEAPAQATILYAVQLPSVGGDTLFADLEAAYAALSPRMQSIIADLRVTHMALGPLQRKRLEDKDYTPDLSGSTGTQVLQALHPLVRQHPETGRPCLFVNGSYLYVIEGLTVEESQPLLSFLCAHAKRPAFTCRIQWQPGSLAVWDNRCTQHCALSDYDERREMLRYTVQGGIPAATRPAAPLRVSG